MNDSRVRWLLGLILAAGFVLRLTYLLEVSRAPDFDRPQFESQYHDYWARALAFGDWIPPEGVTDPELRTRPYFRPPGYPWLLSVVYRIAGPGYFAPRIFQMSLGLVSCLLAFALGRRVFGAGAGLCAAAFLASYWIFVFFEAELMEPPLLIFLLLALTWAASSWREKLSARWAASAGLLLGAAVLVRPNAAVLVPALLLWMSWIWKRRGKTVKGFLRTAALFTAVVLAVTLPATLRNVLVAGDAVWITSNAGINLFVGSHPESNGYTPDVPELEDITGLSGWDSFDHPKIAAAVETAAGREMSDSEVSRVFSRRALRNLAEQPGDVLALTLRKLLLFWGPAEVSNNKVLSLERRHSPTLSASPDFATVLALSGLGLLLLVHHLRRAPARSTGRGRLVENTMLLTICVVAYSASFLPFFVAARFRAPIVPFLAIFAGYSLSRLYGWLRQREWRSLASAVALLAVLRVLTGVAWVPYQDDESLWHWRRGILWEARERPALALDEYRQAVELRPEYVDARLALASLLSATGQPAQAAGEYRRALAFDPRSVLAHNNLASLLALGGDLAGAVRHWEEALALDPGRLSVLGNLAYALATAEDPAIRDVERAIELAERGCRATDYRDPRLLGTLAAGYRAAGREREAEELFRAAERK